MSSQKSPKISVIIPVYNQERYIPQCLDSTLSQTLGDIEVVCVDDGSTDGSGAVLDAYAAKDSRVRVVHRENRGVGPTRNEGLAMARGEFVIFMDPDDYYPDSLVFEKLYGAATEHGALVCGGSLAIYDGEKDTLTNRRDYPNYFAEEGFIDYRDFQFDYGYTRYIYNREMLSAAGAVFPPYKRFQDPPFFVKAMIAAGRFYRISAVSYVYRWSRRFSSWDDERVLHLVSAIRDDLSVAAEHKLYDLFDRTLARVKIDFKKEIAEHQTDAVKAVMSEIMDLSLKVSRNRISEQTPDRHPLVSVVLPVYNAGKFLRQCLNSLKAQTLADMEFICVNDGSTDNSLSIIREFQKGDPRFIAVDKPNSGYGHAVNCGLDVAAGKYIGIVEPDDFVKPEMYERLFSAAEANGVDFVKSGIIYHWANRPDREAKITTDGSLIGRVVSPKEDIGIFNAVMNNVTGVYRRDLIEREHIRFTETPGASYQDNSFYLQVHFLAKSAFLLPESFYFYRQDNAASSINSKGKAFVIFEEYRRNEHLFDGRPDVRAAFYGQYLYKKYKSYKYHLGRIEIYSQIPFLEKMSAEFRAHDERGEIDYGLMAPGQASALKAIVEDWPRYYTTQWQIKVNAEKKKAAELSEQCCSLKKLADDAKAAIERLRKYQQEAANLKSEVAKLKASLDKEGAQHKRLLDVERTREAALAREVKELKSSEAYRTGMCITWPVRRIWRCASRLFGFGAKSSSSGAR